MNTVVTPEQPMPACIAEVCEWLLAAERNVGGGIDTADDLLSVLVAGDALDVLLDVQPPYALVRQPARQAAPSLAIANARASLEGAASEATSVEERLRVARAMRLLRGHAQR